MEEKVETADQTSGGQNPNGGTDDEVKVTDVTDDAKTQAKSAEEGKKDGEGEGKNQSGGDNPVPKQSRETDAINAERRRKAKEREEQRQKEREAEIRRQAVFEVKSGQVTADELRELSLAKVETEDQLFLVENLRKAKAEGLENPVAYAYRELYGKTEAEKAKADEAKKEEEKSKAIVAKDQADFKAKFGKTTADVVKNEPEFMTIFGPLIDPSKGNFTALYTAYKATKGSSEENAKKEGSFPTNAQGGNKPSDPKTGETDEQFKQRYIKEHGRW